MKRYLLAIAAVLFAVFPSSAAAEPAAEDYGPAADAAISKIGKNYVFGTAGPNTFDASGLVMWSYLQMSVRLPRTSLNQYTVTRPIAYDELQKGDLVFFSSKSHVAIFDGDVSMIEAINCPEPHNIPGKDCGVRRTQLRLGGEARTYRK